jgi:hypothetical protein
MPRSRSCDGAWRKGVGLRRRHGPSVPRSARHHAQKKTAHASEQDQPDVVKRRQDWLAGQPALDPDRLVFIDETWASTNMARRYGRCPRGERLKVGIPHGHWKTTTLSPGLPPLASSLLGSSMDRSTAMPSKSMSRRFSSPTSGQATAGYAAT